MKKIILDILLVIAVIGVAVYLTGTFYYKNKFPANVYVNDINVGGMTLAKANNELGKTDVWDKITVKSDTEKFLEIKANKIDYKYIDSPKLPDIFDDQSKWRWVSAFFKDTSYTTPIVSNYNKDTVKNMIDGIAAFDKELLNAKLVYSEETGAFVIEPHSYELALTKEELFNLVAAGIEKREPEVNITNKIQQPDLFDHDEALIGEKNKANQYLNMTLTYDFGDREEIVDGPLIKNWITLEENTVDLDPDKVKEYVVGIAKKYDTYGRSRSFRTSRGHKIKTDGGTYGWVTHRGKTTDALIEHIKEGENKTIEPVYSFEALIRDADDIGNSYVEIDLENQMVYVYVKGVAKIITQTVTGNIARGHDTPTGVYPLNYKETDAVLTGEDYASPVQYWMPFNGNIGLHDADWRDSFGGDIYETNGSNGCINLPPDSAETIFDLVYPGMPVIVH